MFYTLLGVLLVVLDQITKFWAKGALAHGKTIDFIPYIMDFSVCGKRGAAFGICGYALAADWHDGSGARRNFVLRAENKKTPPDGFFCQLR